MKFSEFAEQYLADNTYRFSIGTVKAYKVTNKVFHHYLKNPYLNKITEQDILNFLNTRSKAMARKDLINLNAMFNNAVGKKIIRKNPCSNIAIPKVKRNFPLVFSKVEFDKLISVINCGDTKDLVNVAAYTGLRLGELRCLTPSNIQGNYIILTSLKSGCVRSVPMNGIVKDIVNRNLGKSWIFTYKSDQWKERRVQIRFKKFLKKSGLNPKLHFHCLRHSFATWLVSSGTNLLYVKELLGHSDIKTTLIYTHFFNKNLEEAIGKL